MRKSKTARDNAEQKREAEAQTRALIVVLLCNPVPASAVAAAGVLVAASRMLAREPGPAVEAGAFPHHRAIGKDRAVGRAAAAAAA